MKITCFISYMALVIKIPRIRLQNSFSPTHVYCVFHYDSTLPGSGDVTKNYMPCLLSPSSESGVHIFFLPLLWNSRLTTPRQMSVLGWSHFLPLSDFVSSMSH